MVLKERLKKELGLPDTELGEALSELLDDLLEIGNTKEALLKQLENKEEGDVQWR